MNFQMSLNPPASTIQADLNIGQISFLYEYLNSSIAVTLWFRFSTKYKYDRNEL